MPACRRNALQCVSEIAMPDSSRPLPKAQRVLLKSRRSLACSDNDVVVIEEDASTASSDDDDTETLPEDCRKKIRRVEVADSDKLVALDIPTPTSATSHRRVVLVRAETSDVQGTEEKCTCLRRGGLCSCSDDAAWLRSKRPMAAPKYVPPQRRRLSSTATSEGTVGSASVASRNVGLRPRGAEGFQCTCLKRNGQCTCSVDAKWLQRKQSAVVAYIAPHLRARAEEMKCIREQMAKASAEGADASSAAPPSPNIRTLARKWHAKLENGGAFRFNPLQAEGHVLVADDDGLLAECTELSFGGQGIKALPLIKGGSYQFEVELLRDCALIVGWSSAMSRAATFDSQAYGSASTGQKWHAESEESYSKVYGRAGDVIGALLTSEVNEISGELVSQQVSFALNGKDLGVAFQIGGRSSPLDAKPVPMQPHVCQLSDGSLLHVRIRGLSQKLQLLHQVEGFEPLIALEEAHFCSFSSAVSAASAERQASGLTEEQMRSFCLPDTHILELYDFTDGSSARELAVCVATQLGIRRADMAETLHVHLQSPGRASTSLVAFRRLAHANRLDALLSTASAADDGGMLARPLRHATAAARKIVDEWRGENYRPQSDPSVARRLIHGSLHTQIPLPHLVDEKNRRSAHAES